MNATLTIIADVCQRVLGWFGLDFWQTLLVFMLFMLYQLLARAHTATDNNFDVKYLLVDDKTDRVSLKKLGALVGLLISSWIVLFMTVKGWMTEGILGLYLFVWASVYVTPQTVAAWRNPSPAPPTGGSNGQPTA